MKKLSLVALTALVFAVLPAQIASAWTFSLAGNGACQPDGSFRITWTVNNTTESQPLRITKSSDTSVVAVGDTVAAHQKRDFIQNANGTLPTTFKLTLEGDWPSDTNDRKREATVKLDKACEQPAPVTPTPTEGGRGGGVVQSTQVVAPVGAVNAGDTASKTGVALGLAGSLALAGFGVRRLYRAGS